MPLQIIIVNFQELRQIWISDRILSHSETYGCIIHSFNIRGYFTLKNKIITNHLDNYFASQYEYRKMDCCHKYYGFSQGEKKLISDNVEVNGVKCFCAECELEVTIVVNFSGAQEFMLPIFKTTVQL